MTLIPCTLCFILSDGDTCLMLKRTREPHRGKWNAPGGKVQPGETPEQGCRREVLEETGLELAEIYNLGRIDCLEAGSEKVWRLHLFSARHPQVLVPSSPEGEFAWLPVARILKGEGVVHNIPLFLPLLLRNLPIEGVFEYRQDFLEKYSISLSVCGKGLSI